MHSKEGSEDASYGGVKSVEENRYFERLQEKCGSEHLGEHMVHNGIKFYHKNLRSAEIESAKGGIMDLIQPFAKLSDFGSCWRY